jgi:hypothetical protein
MEDLILRDFGTIHPIPVERNIIIVEDVILRGLSLKEFENFSKGPQANLPKPFTVVREFFFSLKGFEASKKEELVVSKKFSQTIDRKFPDILIRMGSFEEKTEGREGSEFAVHSL